MRILLSFHIVLILAAACAGQVTQPSKKTVPKAQPVRPLFVCPDPDVQQACKSYGELIKAKDTGLPASGYICFRKGADEFLVVTFNKPYFHRTWDKESKQWVTDPSERVSGRGFFESYKDGVDDLSVMPHLVFNGEWFPFGEASVFTSTTVGIGVRQQATDEATGVSIDESQINAGYKYKNQFGKNIVYSLTIQRSTGRFTEKYLEEGQTVPFLENTGRCIYH